MENAVAPQWLTDHLPSRYRLVAEIGRGATATVYHGRDLEHDRDVAVKVLRTELSAALGRERFLREIAIAAQLQHPCIVPLFDSGHAAGVLYYTMPLIRGPSLRDRVEAEGPLPMEDVVRIGVDVADALAYAHTRGLLHRDIKPGNVLLTSGHALVADFGIARALHEAGGQRLTQSGIVVGTPAYMSPEQAGGDQIDERSDLYSLGCLLFEMLAGEPPFSGRTSQALLTKHAVQPAPAIQALRPEIPRGLARLVNGLLAKTPADRPRTAVSVAEQIHRGTLTGPRHRLWRLVHSRSFRRVTALGILVLAGFGVWRVFVGPAPPAIDARSVMAFPLVDRTSEARLPSDVGPTLVASVLEEGDSLRVRHGWHWLSSRDKAGYELLGPEVLRAAARAIGAGYVITGTLSEGADSSSVAVLEVHDAAGDSIVARTTGRGSPGGSSTAIARAAAQVPGLLGVRVPGPARNAERSSVALDHYATAVAAYRSSRFEDARDQFLAALSEDSTFAAAAVEGALATTWLHEWELVDRLVKLAFRHDDELPLKHRSLGRAVSSYWNGDADSALLSVQGALLADSTWAMAHAFEGEIYYHLMPSVGPLDSLAEVALETARATDPGFSPPLFHLAEMRIRRGELTEADSLTRLFSGFEPDATYPRRLALMLDCVDDRQSGSDWTAMLATALQLVVAGRQPRCAERATRGVLAASGDTIRSDRWGAFFALQGLRVAERRDAEAAAAIDSAIQAGNSGDQLLYLLFTMAGADMAESAAGVQAIADRIYAESLEGINPLFLWLFGTWYAHKGDLVQTKRYATAARSSAASSDDRQLAQYARSLGGQVARLEGDTMAAIRAFRALRPVADPDALTWGYGEPYPVERIELARMLLARGAPAEAYSVARAIDHPGPVVFIAYLPASLQIRLRAALAMGRPDLARGARERLIRLGREDLLQNTSTEEES